MTAALPGINPVAARCPWRRLLTPLLAAAVAWTPWALVWGDDLSWALDFDQSATAGQTLGTTLGTDPASLAPFDHPADFSHLFPGADQGAVTDWTSLYGQSDALQAAGAQSQRDRVVTPFAEASKTDQAYQTLLAPIDRPRPLLTNEALWGVTDGVAASIEDFTATYADCTWDTKFLTQPRTVHVPAYEACLIPKKDQPKLTCSTRRTLEARVWWEPVVVGQRQVPQVVVDPLTGQETSTFTLEDIIEWVRRVEKTRDDWSPLSAVCVSTLNARLMDGFCRSQTTCLSNPDAACVAVPGGELCHGELVSPPYLGQTGSEPWEQFSGIGAACLQVEVALDCTSFNEGTMDCWSDPQGVEHCPDNPGDQATAGCEALTANPSCRLVSRQCAEAATGKTGVCYVDQLVYDCGTDQTIDTVERVSTLHCGGSSACVGEACVTVDPGPIRCLGTECVALAPEQSADFGTAVAALQAAEVMALDGDCAGGHCQVFTGTARTCKRAVGGIVNCCQRPEGVSLGNYLQLMFSIAKLDSVTLALAKAGVSNPAFGAWETLRSPVVDTWGAVQDAFTSAVNNITGNTTAATTEAAKQGVMAAFKQQLMQQTAQWTAQVFGPQAANALFVNATTGGAAIGADGLATGTVALNPAIMVVMYWVMWAYLIYTIVMILIHLIWKCTQDEFQLGVQRELKACHRVGSYCRKKILGACIESRDSYCCFNTPLSRILNEQIRGQFGRGFGSAKHPDCSGLGVADLAQVDWSRIDLSEWLAMLTAANLIVTPSDQMTFEALTEGQGNRTAMRLDDLRDVQTVGGANRAAETQGWSETLPTLPRPAEATP